METPLGSALAGSEPLPQLSGVMTGSLIIHHQRDRIQNLSQTTGSRSIPKVQQSHTVLDVIVMCSGHFVRLNDDSVVTWPRDLS